MIGEELGSYRVLEAIGKGGMASVFVGEHSVLGHQVAIKLLHTDQKHTTAEKRFINEAKVIASVHHPGIVELFDFGRGPDGRAYIVMELLQGETLRSRMRRGIMDLDKVLVFARQIASAVCAAHEKKVIHRDLKPDNIFLVPDPEVEFGERIKILDFGVAKSFDQNNPVKVNTATGVLVGTPAYMSPEQCRGQSKIDGRADIYALGVVVYRMVTGKLPFTSAGTGELIGQHIYEDAIPPREINANVPEALSELIVKCMAKEPGERVQTMAEVAEAFARLRTKAAPAMARVPVAAPTAPTMMADSGPLESIQGITVEPAPPPPRRPWPMAIAIALAVGVFVALVARDGPAVEANPEELPRSAQSGAIEPDEMELDLPEEVPTAATDSTDAAEPAGSDEPSAAKGPAGSAEPAAVKGPAQEQAKTSVAASEIKDSADSGTKAITPVVRRQRPLRRPSRNRKSSAPTKRVNTPVSKAKTPKNFESIKVDSFGQ